MVLLDGEEEEVLCVTLGSVSRVGPDWLRGIKGLFQMTFSCVENMRCGGDPFR